MSHSFALIFRYLFSSANSKDVRYAPENLVYIIHDLFISESESCDPVRAEKHIAVSVIFNCSRSIMYSIVRFDRKHHFGTIKICYIRTNSMLSSEFITGQLFFPKDCPQYLLCLCCIVSKVLALSFLFFGIKKFTNGIPHASSFHHPLIIWQENSRKVYSPPLREGE